MTVAVSDGVVWPPARSPWAVWADPPSLGAVLAGGPQSAVVSVWADVHELAAGGLGHEQLSEVLEALRLNPSADQVAGLGAPVRFLAAALEEETSRLAQAALWLAAVVDQPHRPGRTDVEIATIGAAAASVGACLSVGDLQPASAHQLRWLWGALEWGGGVVEEAGATVRRRCGEGVTHHAFLVGRVEDEAWPLIAERLPFSLAWCVRRAPQGPAARPTPAPAVGIVAVAADSVGQLEGRVERLQVAYRLEDRELTRPREQLVLAAATAPWSRLSRRLWRRATRSVLAGA